MNGNKIAGEHAGNYVLSKEKYAILEKYWKLAELMDKPVTMDSTFRNEPHILFKDEDNLFMGNGGCNNFSGTYQLGDMNRISLSQAAATQMACSNMDVERNFLRF